MTKNEAKQILQKSKKVSIITEHNIYEIFKLEKKFNLLYPEQNLSNYDIVWRDLAGVKNYLRRDFDKISNWDKQQLKKQNILVTSQCNLLSFNDYFIYNIQEHMFCVLMEVEKNGKMTNKLFYLELLV